MLRRLLAAVGVAALVAGCGSEGRSASRQPAPTSTTVTTSAAAPSPHISTVARAAVPEVNIFEFPGQPVPVRSLVNPQEPYKTPLGFLVQEAQGEWLRVLLPVRPNGSTGWIRRADVTTFEHNFRILVELGAHQITVFRGEEVILQEPVGVGTADTPTPGGLYYTKELLRPEDDQGRPMPNGPYGPYVYTLSGYSEVLFDFAGGEGVIGIHGTNDPSGLGKDVSHGCIRMSNEGITMLASTFDIGVPVEIRA